MTGVSAATATGAAYEREGERVSVDRSKRDSPLER